MTHYLFRYRLVVVAAVVLLVFGSLFVGRALLTQSNQDQLLPRAASKLLAESDGAEREREREFQEGTQGLAEGGAGGESAEALTAAQQWAEARTAPGIVNPGAYTHALDNLNGLAVAGGSWDEVTDVAYDADDINYRDYYSNSGGGSGLVTGRITALAADDSGNVYVGGANGGVWRSTTGGGNWEPIADALPSLSSGDLQINPVDGSLWYATGEANTGGTSYVGAGVFRLAGPTGGTFSMSDRVGGEELESTTINAIRFSPDGTVWIATLRGIYSHSATGDFDTAWHRSFAPNLSYLPGGANAGNANAAYKNIVNDLAIDPEDPDHIIAGVGWRSGDSYNGFYETWDHGSIWTKVNLKGGLDKNDIGNVSFAWSADGSKLYVMNQSPKLIQSFAAIPMTYLDGIYVSNKGTLDGPWTRIATADKLASGGSALARNYGVGYRPGIQSWYNQFLLVDPTDANHVFAGLEEVYETKDGGQHWTTIGPYWNFYFGCWAPDAEYPPSGNADNRCPQTTHPDQHSVAVGSSEAGTFLYVGNDGGVYRRPLDGETNRAGHATDWESLNDGSIDALQYYAVGVGLANGSNPQTPAGSGAIVSGGLQDNGGSIYRIGAAGMSSNFGGDGGDVLVDPNDGCNIVQEYVYLSMEVTNNCASPDDLAAFLDPSVATTWDIAPPDINARFIAPFVADDQDINLWLAGGNSIWFQDNGFAIRSGSEWHNVHTFASPVQVATAMAYNGGTAVAGWCGPCNNSGFARGVAVGHFNGSAWTWTDADLSGSDVPNRYVGGAAVDDAGNVYVVMNGFSRRFTEGPGAGIGHVFKSTDGGATWISLDDTAGGDFPDVPANSIKVLDSGALVVGTDLGVVYLDAGGTGWYRLGDNFPVTVAIDVEVAPDGYIYAATHGRGIWRIDAGL